MGDSGNRRLRQTRPLASCFLIALLMSAPGSEAIEPSLLHKSVSTQPSMLDSLRAENLAQEPTAAAYVQPPPVEESSVRQSRIACGTSGVITRKSVTDMSENEWTQYVAAFNRLRQRRTRRGPSVYERFSQIHLDYALHRQAAFLPWHREMLWRWDQNLARGTPRGEPPARQPYYEWAMFPENPFVSIVSRDTRYGGSGEVGGAFGSLVSNVPTRHRVRRSYQDSAVLTSADTMNLLRTRVADFNAFRVTLEANHNAFHVRVGGDMASIESPNDPYFYAHHAYIDKIYREWEIAGNRVQTGVDLSLRMRPWNTTAAQAIARGHCVRYEDSRIMFRRAANVTPSTRREKALAALRTAEEASRKFGASEAEIALARNTTEALLLEEGISISGE